MNRLFNRPGSPSHEFPTRLQEQFESGGHYVLPIQQIRLERLEPQPKPYDHYSRLFFGRTTAVQIGQPFFIWQATQTIVEPDAISWRANHDLNRFRTTFQTVGQPWNTWPAYQAPAFEVEQIRQPPSPLFPFRQFAPTQTVGQPFFIWQAQPRFEPTVEIIKQPDHAALNLYRVGFQTVSQSWATWPKYQQPTFELEKIQSPQYELSPYRQITITAGPGQPWYQWPPIKIEIQPEEQIFRTDHALALYPFLPHPAAPVIPVVIPDTSGDGSGRHDTFPPRHRKDLTLLEREKERKKLFRKSKIKYQLPPEEQQIVEDAVQTAAITKPLADGLAPEAIKAKTTYLETLLRGLEQTEKLNAQILSSLFDMEVENRLLEFEEEEAIAILTAWWMNEA